MLKSILRTQELDVIKMDKEMDRMGYWISSRINILKLRHEEFAIHVGIMDEKLARESVLLEKEAAQARLTEYCQFLEMEGLNSTQDDFKSLHSQSILGMDLDTLRSNTILCEDPAIRETSLGLRVMMRPTSTIISPPLKSGATFCGRGTEMVFSCHADLSIHISPSTFSSEKKRRIMEKVHAKILSAIDIMKNSEESKLLLENDYEFKSQYENLLAMKARVVEKKLITEAVKTKNSTEPPHSPLVSELEDPGSFSIPCIINGMPIPKCILDLEANKSIMPLKMAWLEGNMSIKCINTKLVLAD